MAKKVHKKVSKRASSVSIIPTEMRLSFQPGRAEISGQTLRWIQAFASKVAEDPGSSLEIRIDGSAGTELQQRRLNLLHNILMHKGVEYSKIHTVFTSRGPNSFILRTVAAGIDVGEGVIEKANKRRSNYIQW